MIYSMTAFARQENQGSWGVLTGEMRSVNHRYLEISLHLSEPLRAYEMPLKERIRKVVKRGKIDCLLRYQPVERKGNVFTLNVPLAEELCLAGETIVSFLKQPAPICPTDILRFPGVLEMKETDLSELEPQVFLLVDNILDELMRVRAREGEALSHFIFQRIDRMSAELMKVRERLPQVMLAQQERLKKRFHDAVLELDPSRLEQEMLMFAQKIDISEEVDRIEMHLNEIERVLKQGGIVGRRLDFLLQELNREANTLGSKSVDSIIMHAGVEMKVLTEQMREQIQNME